jgi:hypothetical protein
MGLPLSNEDEKTSSLVKKKLFSSVIQPILALPWSPPTLT